MKRKMTYEEALELATESFKILIVYFNVTRPMNNKAYFKNGKFDIEEYTKQMKFLTNWNNMPSIQKKALAKTYINYNSTFNYTQGIPVELLRNLCRVWYYDNEGKRTMLKYGDVTKRIISTGKVKYIPSGSKFKKNEDGKYEKKCWWCHKYLIDPKLQFTLMGKSQYSDITTFPRTSDETSMKYLAYARTKDAILSFYSSSNKSDNGAKEKVPVKEEVSETEKLVKRYAVNYVRGLASSEEVENELRACHRKQKEIDEIITALDKLKRQTKKTPNRREEYFNKKKAYLNGVIEYTEFRNWMTANNVLETIIKQWDDVELQRVNERAQEAAKQEAEKKEKEEATVKLSNEDIDEIIRGMGK